MKWLIFIGLKIAEIIAGCVGVLGVMGIGYLIVCIPLAITKVIDYAAVFIVCGGVLLFAGYWICRLIKLNLEWSNQIALWLKKRKEK